MALPVLDASEQRILGCLLEKQRTVPASYPLSLNALRQACNQTSSRHPVLELSERDIQDAARTLKDQGLLRLVWAGAGSRVVKYHQLLDEVLGLADDERALITVLLLRGAQSAGELRTRTDRIHSFADKAAVEDCLARMASAPEPLVRETHAARGRDTRWIHLLGPIAGAEPAPATDLELVLSAGAAARDQKVLAAYDAAAAACSEAVLDEPIGPPFDIWLLEQLAARTDGPVLDLGCGAGQIAAFLADAGLQVHGMDGSAEMIRHARACYEDLDFAVGRFHQVLRPRDAAAWDTILAWYSFVHLAPSELTPILTTLAATLRPGGTLVLALYLGEGIIHTDDLFGVPVDLDFVLHDRERVLAAASAAGLEPMQWYVRSPAPGELPTNRLYLLASRAG